MRVCIAIRYAGCMAQLVTRIDDSLLAQIDELVADGVVRSRSEAVRRGVGALVERHRRALVGEAMVEAYRRQPQTDAEVGWADAATTTMIALEPW